MSLSGIRTIKVLKVGHIYRPFVEFDGNYYLLPWARPEYTTVQAAAARRERTIREAQLRLEKAA